MNNPFGNRHPGNDSGTVRPGDSSPSPHHPGGEALNTPCTVPLGAWYYFYQYPRSRPEPWTAYIRESGQANHNQVSGYINEPRILEISDTYWDTSSYGVYALIDNIWKRLGVTKTRGGSPPGSDPYRVGRCDLGWGGSSNPCPLYGFSHGFFDIPPGTRGVAVRWENITRSYLFNRGAYRWHRPC